MGICVKASATQTKRYIKALFVDESTTSDVVHASFDLNATTRDAKNLVKVLVQNTAITQKVPLTRVLADIIEELGVHNENL